VRTESVTVVIPAYNASRTIRRCADSVVRQTLPPAQVLVVDDGSQDSSDLAEALQGYGSAITLLRKSNGGAASARNYAVDRARSEWVAFIDADDYWEPRKLELQMAAAHANPDVSVIGCRWYVEVPGASRVIAVADAPQHTGRVLQTRGRAAFYAALASWTGCLVVRREALGRERFATGLEPAEDRDLWVRLFASHLSYMVPDVLATYVQEPGGISRTDIDRDCGNMLRVVRRHAALLGSGGVREQEAIVYLRWAAVHLAQGRPGKALVPALQRLRLQPYSCQAWWIAIKSALRHAIGVDYA
jgi:glycosyltransferase involved in cell wall biosynthesis